MAQHSNSVISNGFYHILTTGRYFYQRLQTFIFLDGKIFVYIADRKHPLGISGNCGTYNNDNTFSYEYRHPHNGKIDTSTMRMSGTLIYNGKSTSQPFEYQMESVEWMWLSLLHSKLLKESQPLLRSTAQVKSQIETQDGNIKSMNITLSDMSQNMEKIRTQIHTLKQEITENESQHKLSVDQIRELQEENEKIRKNTRTIDSQNDELRNKRTEFQTRLKRLNIQYQKKQSEKKVENIEYDQWNSDDVTEWIIHLDDGAYSKYENVIRSNLKKEGIDGSEIKYLERNDLGRIGITNFKHKRMIMQHIANLK
eukprot:346392_1